ncbi:TonB-dependent receptor [bacterium]|nr:TonB-dependent receptor [bacterium]
MFRSTIKKLTLLVTLGLLSVPVNLFSGTTGKITGIVKDKETGDALPGVNIILDGTTMGAATNASGEFTIINVPAGVYSISTSMIGYTKVTKQNVRVLPDFTTRLDFELSPESLGGEEVIIVAERPLIQKDQTMTMTVTSSEEIKNLPVRGFQAVANLGVGLVVNNNRNIDGGTGNVNIRGGRPNETGVLVDGFLQNNLLTGLSFSSVPSGSVEEVQVITGGFDAEYGRVQSGIIQVTSKSGKQVYSGNLEYVGDPGGLGIAESYGYNVFSGGIGGPIIPGNNKIKFYVSGEGRNIKDSDPSVFGFPQYSLSSDGIRGVNAADIDTVMFDTDAQGNVKYKKGARPNNFSGNGANSDKAMTLQGKLTFDVMSNLRLDINANYSKQWRRIFNIQQTIWTDQVELRTTENLNIGGVATYTMSPTSFIDFGVNYFDYERRRMQDELGFNVNNYPGKQTGTTGFSTYYNDNLFWDFGTSPLNFRQDNDKYIAFKSNYTNQVDKHNQVKAGFDLFYHTVRYLNIVDTDQPVGGSNDNIGYEVVDPANPKIREVSSDDLENKILGPAKPISFSFFLQDKMEYEGLVLRGGIRYDLFNAGVKQIKNLADPTGQEDPDQIGIVNGSNRTLAGTLGAEDYKSSRNDSKISPRLSLSFPISEKTQFRMSYGKFFQQPRLQDLYVSPDFLERQSLAPPFAITVGNPNLKAEESTQYEVGIRRSLSDNIAVDVNAYYKDISNLINSRLVASVPNSLIMFDNEDEGVVQGLSLALEMRRISKFQGRVAYTLQSARGSGSAQNSGFRASWLGYSDTKFNAPLNFDQRHTINANLDVRNAKGEGPDIGGTHILENAGVNFQMNAGSGLPYTPTTIVPILVRGVPQGRVVARRNSQNQPWTFRIDMRADKTINLTDKMSVNVYVQVLNLLDRKNVLTVFTATGQANDDGYLSTPAGQALNERQLQQYRVNYKDGLPYDTPRQARLGVLFNF